MRRSSIVSRMLRPLGSFGLACVLLVLLFALTFFGTFEQADHALYDVQKRYFESWLVVTDATVFGVGPIRIPLPGGVPLMGLLGLNLIIGGLVRIRWNLRTIGIIVAHIGVVWMLVAALVKQRLSDDGALKLYEGESSAEYVSYYRWEVAIWEVGGGSTVVEHVIPQEEFHDLRGERTGTFRARDLPFTVALSHFLPNCRAMPKGPMWTAETPTIDGYALDEVEREKEAEFNRAGLVARVEPRSGGTLEGLLLGEAEHWNMRPDLPWTFEADGRAWAVTLRHERYPMPFTVRLEDFVHELHPRTNTAKKYQSDVTLLEGDEARQVRISMNQPLRDRGLVLFQSGYGPQNDPNPPRMFSIFSVVRNPSDHWPLYSCIVISVGLAFAFLVKLVRHITSQSNARARALTQS
jgi:hypothetical protein